MANCLVKKLNQVVNNPNLQKLNTLVFDYYVTNTSALNQNGCVFILQTGELPVTIKHPGFVMKSSGNAVADPYDVPANTKVYWIAYVEDNPTDLPGAVIVEGEGIYKLKRLICTDSRIRINYETKNGIGSLKYGDVFSWSAINTNEDLAKIPNKENIKLLSFSNCSNGNYFFEINESASFPNLQEIYGPSDGTSSHMPYFRFNETTRDYPNLVSVAAYVWCDTKNLPYNMRYVQQNGYRILGPIEDFVSYAVSKGRISGYCVFVKSYCDFTYNGNAVAEYNDTDIPKPDGSHCCISWDTSNASAGNPNGIEWLSALPEGASDFAPKSPYMFEPFEL